MEYKKFQELNNELSQEFDLKCTCFTSVNREAMNLSQRNASMSAKKRPGRGKSREIYPVHITLSKPRRSIKDSERMVKSSRNRIKEYREYKSIEDYILRNEALFSNRLYKHNDISIANERNELGKLLYDSNKLCIEKQREKSQSRKCYVKECKAKMYCENDKNSNNSLIVENTTLKRSTQLNTKDKQSKAHSNKDGFKIPKYPKRIKDNKKRK